MKAIVLADTRVQELLADHPFSIGSVGLWTGTDLQLIGGTVNLRFAKPAQVNGEWLSFSWLDCESDPLPSPVIVPYRATYAAVGEISVMVNLSTGEIEQIVPRVGGKKFRLIGNEQFTGAFDEIRTCSND